MTTSRIVRSLVAFFALLIAQAAAIRAQRAPSSSDRAAAYERGRRYMAWLRDGEVDSLEHHMSEPLLGALRAQGGLAAVRVRLRERTGVETALVREAVYVAPGRAGTEYYRIARYANAPDTTLTTRWAWRGDTILGVTTAPTSAPAASGYLGYQTKTALHLPFAPREGESWYVAWGGRSVMENYHAVAPDQRFAYDFALAREDGLFTGTGAANTDHHCFGTPVLAPAAGIVVKVVDSVADNVPGVVNSAAPPGNYVVIDHGGGEHSLLAHFRRGSVRVRQGDRVATGQQLAECGNSGQSTMPHLHYHLQTGRDYRDGVGLPAFFNEYTTDGRRTVRGEPARGEYLRPNCRCVRRIVRRGRGARAACS
jgi:hypothetical protein